MAEEVTQENIEQADDELVNPGNLPDDVFKNVQEILNHIEQPGFYDLSYLKGLVETVTSVPTHIPSRFEQQVKLYVDSVTAPTVKRLYIYSNQTNEWYDVPFGSNSSLSKDYTVGESLTANDAVMLASGSYVNNTITQTTQDSNFHIYGTNWVGQTFTTSASTVAIVGIKVRLALVGALNQASHIMIKAVSGGVPTGDSLVDLSSTPTVTADADEYTFTFNSPVAVSPSTTYALIVDFFHGDSSNYIACYYNSSSVYAGGTYISTSDSGANWTADANKDLYFKIQETYHTAGRIYKADADTDGELSENFIGFVTASGSAGDTKSVKISGSVSGFSGLTPGRYYYLSTTAGGISLTKAYPGTVGLATSSTELKIITLQEPVKVIASDNLKISANTQATYTSDDTYQKKKEIQVFRSGTYRVKFDLKGNADFTAYGRVYKDDVAYGTEQSVAAPNSTFQTFSEDLVFKAGDKVQLYTKTANTYSVSQRNFRLYFDKTIANDSDGVITN